jgi:hypothetical protein
MKYVADEAAWTLSLQNDGLCHGKGTKLMTFTQLTYQSRENHLDDVGQLAVRFMVVIHFLAAFTVAVWPCIK